MISLVSKLEKVTEFALEVQLPQTLEEIMQRLVDRSAALCRVARASLRILDASGMHLLAVCRSGPALHNNANFEFVMGEGLIGWVAVNAKAVRSGCAEKDPRFLHRPDIKERVNSFCGVPLLYQGKVLGVLSVVHPEKDYFTEENQQTLSLLAAICAPHLEIARLGRMLQIDPVTGTLSRLGLDSTLPSKIDEIEGPLSVCIADVDRFGDINRTNGAEAADQVLKEVAQAVAGSLRVGDCVARYGADEFLSILPGVGLASAMRIAERVRSIIEKKRIGAQELRVTVSIGVAERRVGEKQDSLIERAGVALAESKRQQPNMVRRAAEEADTKPTWLPPARPEDADL